MNDAAHQAASALSKEWGLQLPETVAEETIINLLADRLTAIIAEGPDAFYRLMYRLDISEKKLNAVLNHPDTPQKIARLVYDRQLQKIKSRMENKGRFEDGDGDMRW